MLLIDLNKIDQDIEYECFTIDTETSGFKGKYPAHSTHRIIQICAIHLSGSTDEFNKYITDVNNELIEESTAIHGITKEYLRQYGEPIEKVIHEFLIWVFKYCNKVPSKPKKPLFIAHSAQFDRDILLKSINLYNGKEGECLGFQWLDTLECTRKIFGSQIDPNLDKQLYKNPPFNGFVYSLRSLINHFYGSIEGEFHNALYDSKCLGKLFVEKILPEIWDSITGINPVYDTPGMIIERNNILSTKSLDILKLIKTCKYSSTYIKTLVNVINYDFYNAGPEWKIYITNENLVTAGHIFLYAWMKTLIDVSMGVTSPTSENKDTWTNIFKRVELLFRTRLNIYSDEIILDILGLISNRTPTEVVSNTIKEINSDTSNKHTLKNESTQTMPIFPTLAGERESYLPFKLSAQDAMTLYQSFGICTAHDIYIHSRVNGPFKKWQNRILSTISNEGAPQFLDDICNENFSLIIPSLKYNS
jgi:DNA polymerase III epsilon subunit-like protein